MLESIARRSFLARNRYVRQGALILTTKSNDGSEKCYTTFSILLRMRLLREARFRLGSARHAHELHCQIRAFKSENDRMRKKYEEQGNRLRALRRSRFRLQNPEPEQDRIETFKSLISPLSGQRLLDLGCGHGKFSIAAADVGWAVVGVDARIERMPDDSRIEWLQSDVREYPVENFDVISVLGLLYHLDQPSQMDLLKRCAASGASVTILDTHVGLSQKVSEGGYSGAYYKEPEQGLSTSSWSNAISFWPTEESLIKMSRDAGFSLITPVRPPREKHRTFYVCYPKRS